jgi:hypothetical protein
MPQLFFYPAGKTGWNKKNLNIFKIDMVPKPNIAKDKVNFGSLLPMVFTPLKNKMSGKNYVEETAFCNFVLGKFWSTRILPFWQVKISPEIHAYYLYFSP